MKLSEVYPISRTLSGENSSRSRSSIGDSVLFGWAYDRTQNIVVAMISHGLSNTVAVVITLISVL